MTTTPCLTTPYISTADAQVDSLNYAMTTEQELNSWHIYEFERTINNIDVTFRNEEGILKRYCGDPREIYPMVFEDINLDLNKYI